MITCDPISGVLSVVFYDDRDVSSTEVNKPMSEQKTILEKAFNDWKGNVEQVDDIVVLGIKI